MGGLFMRFLPFYLLAIATFAVAVPMRAQILYDNGPRSGRDGVGLDNYIEAESFTLTSAARVQRARFWSFETANGFQGFFVWQIYANSESDSPGPLLLSGTSTNLVRQLNGAVLGFLEFVNTFDVTAVALQPGTYWLALHNGPLTYTVPLDYQQGVYWEASLGGNTPPSNGRRAPYNDAWFSNDCPECTVRPPSELALQIEGVRGPQITSFISDGGVPRIGFTTTSGQTYRVEYKNNLTDQSWITLSGAEMIAGTGGPVQISDPDASGAHLPHRFYRVLLL
jgi:hypothetical protein